MFPNYTVDPLEPVLLVEDEALIATEVEQMLRSIGYQDITVCLTYKAAKARLSKGGFGLAIFDINVGGMLSYGLISEAMAMGCAVVTISGYVSSPDAQSGRVFLSKPVDEHRLAGAVLNAHQLKGISKAS